jgi:uncharacterized protein YndB with AHSA1/START domain
MYGLDDQGWIVESGGSISAGGTWSVAFGPSRGELYRFTHRFEEIDRLRRVVFRSNEAGPGGPDFDTEVEVTFEEEGGGTRMTVVQRGFPSAEVRDFHEGGMPHAFDRIERIVRKRVSKEGTNPP